MINRGVLKLRALLPLSLTARAFRVRAKVRRDLAEFFERHRPARLAHGARRRTLRSSSR